MKKGLPQVLPQKLNNIKRTRFATCMLIAVVAALLLSTLFSIGFYSHIQIKLSDFLYGGGTASDNIVIVAIDDISIQEIGRWPWGRGNFTDLILNLDEAKVIGLDVAFFEASDTETDMRLAEIIRSVGNVVMPAEYTHFEQDGNNIIGEGLVTPLPELVGAAAGLGYINVITDKDGITRAANFDVKSEFNPFAEEIINQYFHKRFDKKSRMLINFVGNPGSYTRYSFSDVMRGKFSREEFKDKIVLVGSTAANLHDDYFVPTSYGKAMPGVEIHANIIQQILTGKDLDTAPDWLTILTIFFVAFAVALIALYVPLWVGAIISAGMFILYTFVAIFAFSAGILINLIYVPGTIIMTYLATMIYFYISEKRSRKKVLGAFEKYVSKDVINHILEHPDRLKLGGEKRIITVFFSDIRGFTTISEKLTPEQLVTLLNEYLTEMTNIILDKNGVVDKYMGDAIMAFWNAPLNQPKHAELACDTCLLMETRLKELQKKWTSEGVPSLEIGIGLNTGPASVGNMGSYDRFDYTAMGDTVNLGARLEGLNKPYGTRILISASTREKIKKKPYLVRKLDSVQVKGKKQPIIIYELLCKKDKAKPELINTVECFEKGLELYFKQKWVAAITEFKKADKLRKEGDAPSKAFIERCTALKKDSPGKKWNGVWVMKTK